jgi:hypothetical protein
MFGGSCSAPIIYDDYDLPAGIGISGFSSVTFSNYRGEPSSIQNFTINGSSGTVTVTINMVGGINVN